MGIFDPVDKFCQQNLTDFLVRDIMQYKDSYRREELFRLKSEYTEKEETMNQELAFKKLGEVIPDAVDLSTRKLRVSPQQVLDVFGKSPILCNDIVTILPFFSKEEREEIEEGIYQKQQAFWNNPAQVKYYTEIHPQLPSVLEHFAHFTNCISPEEEGVVVDLGCGCGALMKRLLEKNKSVKIVGIDYAPHVLDVVSGLVPNLGTGRIELINHDLRKGIPLPDASQTRIVSNWGIVNLLPDDLQRSFFEVYRVLKPGGRFTFSALIEGKKISAKAFWNGTPNKLGFLWMAINSLGRGIAQKGWKFEKELHLLFPVYSVEELVEMAERAKQGIIQKEYTLMGRSITMVTQKSKS